MNVDLINPFLEAVANVIKTMAFMEPKAGKPFRKRPDDPPRGDVTGIIGMTGPVNGAVAVSFSEQAILQLMSNMFGETCQEINGEVQDAVGELTNMISGDARRALAEKGYDFKAAIPTVIMGTGHRIVHAIPGQSVIMPFALEQNAPFFVEVYFEDPA